LDGRKALPPLENLAYVSLPSFIIGAFTPYLVNEKRLLLNVGIFTSGSNVIGSSSMAQFHEAKLIFVWRERELLSQDT
tara:strand:- start:1 stop:234 length:234 start_codon:yes stop_codon:yes gene_type:complete